jgi:YD repeat-containing protein
MVLTGKFLRGRMLARIDLISVRLLFIVISMLCSWSFNWAITNNQVDSRSDEKKTDRQLHGLAGPVRSIRTETEKVNQKSKTSTDNRAVLVETTLFDPKGNTIEAKYFPVPGAVLTGKESYKYDENGNLIETTFLRPDGSILRKEIYSYDFDHYGNWTKMITSVATVKGGEWTIDIAEITYRTIEYYKEALIANNTKPSDSAAEPVLSIIKNNTSTIDPSGNTNKSESNAPKPVVIESIKKEKEALSSSKEKESEQKSGIKAVVSSISPINTANPEFKSSAATPKPPSKPISKGVLNGAAIKLPMPIYPEIARRTRASGGRVISAQAVSGPAVLYQATIKAAYNALFTPSMLAGQPVKTVGIITYNLSVPE